MCNVAPKIYASFTNQILNNNHSVRTYISISNCDLKFCFEVKDLYITHEKKMYLDMGTARNINHPSVIVIQQTF